MRRLETGDWPGERLLSDSRVQPSTGHHHLPAHEVLLLLETDGAKGLSGHAAPKGLA